MRSVKISLLFVLVNLSSTITLAHPDVFFSDSADYQEAHLIHKFSGDNIKFELSSNVANIIIPNHAYNFDALVNFVRNIYQFADPSLKKDFVQMFEMSIESSHGTLPFLTELVSMLQRFAARHPEHVH